MIINYEVRLYLMRQDTIIPVMQMSKAPHYLCHGLSSGSRHVKAQDFFTHSMSMFVTLIFLNP